MLIDIDIYVDLRWSGAITNTQSIGCDIFITYYKYSNHISRKRCS